MDIVENQPNVKCTGILYTANLKNVHPTLSEQRFKQVMLKQQYSILGCAVYCDRLRTSCSLLRQLDAGGSTTCRKSSDNHTVR
jgi:hypothetical protein